MKNKKNIQKLIQLAKPYSIHIFIVAILIIVSGTVSALLPKIIWQIPDIVIENIRHGVDVDYSRIFVIILQISGLGVVGIFGSIAAGFILANVSANFTSSLRRQIFQKLQKVTIDYYNKNKTGEIITVVNEDTSIIGETMATTLTSFFSQAFSILSGAVILLSISLELFLVTLVSVVIIVLYSKFILKKNAVAQRNLRKAKGKVNNELEEYYTNQILVYTNAKEDFAANRISLSVDDLGHKFIFANVLTNLLQHGVNRFISGLGQIALLLIGGFLMLGGKLSFGSLQAAWQYFYRIKNPILFFVQTSSTFQEIFVAADHIFAILDAEEDIPEMASSDVKAAKTGSIVGHITFDKVNFYYEDIHVIQDFSVDIKPGSKVAIVGPTGSGKTTLVSLLMRFFEPTSGQILLDGVPISQIPRSKLRSYFGMVLQDAWLSDGTIMDNITYANPQITNSEVRQVLEKIKINHIFESLPKSYNTKVGSDSDDPLSVGEKQLATIARVIIANPKMIILDEATSNVDTRTEQIIQSAMNKLMEHRTTFIIAHRLSTILDADLILVIKDGKIIEQGNHSELIAKHGFYEQLYNSQFEEI